MAGPVARAVLAPVWGLIALLGAATAAAEIHPDAEALIVGFEVGSEQRYTARYQRPIWPGAASGVTVGIGYDLGHQQRSVILADWHDHPQRERMASAAGVRGQSAKALAATLQDVRVTWPQAMGTFRRTSLVTYRRIARRVFIAEQFDRLPERTQGALVSLVYNRGGSMVGPARAEMRAIRDDCLPRSDTRCVAAQIRAMNRLWRGSSIEAGMHRRREAEAVLAERT